MNAVIATMRKSPYVLVGTFGLILALSARLNQLRGVLVPADPDFIWQIVTGAPLAAAMGYQWVLFIQRMTGFSANPRLHYVAHRWVGVFATLLFALHGVRFGYYWMTALAVVFFLTALSGLFNREVVRYSKPWIFQTWLVLHIAFSSVMVPLIVVHVWVALAYQR